MNSQRLISDARREAKRLARISGRPHQNHLDEIAVLAGASDWSAYLASPMPIPPAPADATSGNVPANVCRLTHQDCLVLASIAVAALTLVVPIDRPPVLDIVVIASGILMMSAVMPATLRHVYEGLIYGKAKALPWRHSVRTFTALATTFGMLGIIYARNLPGPDVVNAVEDDRQSSQTIRLLPGMPYVPIAAADRKGDRVTLKVVLADGRFGAPSFRWAFKPPERVGGSALQAAYQHHPVIRAAVEADCASGTYSMTGVEAASAYRTPAAYRYDMRGRPPRRLVLPVSTRTILCGTRA